VNYADGLIPIDRWMGTWHDGSAEGDRLMKDRFMAKKARLNPSSSGPQGPDRNP